MMTGGGANCQLEALIEVLAPFTKLAPASAPRSSTTPTSLGERTRFFGPTATETPIASNWLAGSAVTTSRALSASTVAIGALLAGVLGQLVGNGLAFLLAVA
jgi:hypothetical protein